MKKNWVLVLLVLFSISETALASGREISILKKGGEGKEIFLIQEILGREGYVPEFNGIFGPKTREAVVAFQKVNGLKRDGIVGPQTRAALKNPKKPFLLCEEEGNYVEVDLRKQVLYLIENGEITAIIPISSGSSGRETPIGRYRVYRLLPGWHKVVNRPWGGRVYNSIYFKKAYAIHGYSSVPVYPASRGCIRVPLVYADLIYLKIGIIGQVVYIY